SLEDFRGQWEIFNLPDYSETFDDLFLPPPNLPNYSIAQERDIRYFPDGQETNDTKGNASVLSTSANPITTLDIADLTLFKTAVGTGDEDWFQVYLLAGTFTVETRNLRSGCDTVLELYDDTGSSTPLVSNDDRALNDYSSIINLEILTPGDYYIRVTAFVGENANTENGSYDLSLESLGNYLPSITVHNTPPTVVAAPTPVTFDVSASDSDGYILFYEWDFDGDDFFESSSIEGGKITHTFAMEGSYTVAVRVTDNKGGKSYQSFPMTVTAPPANITLTAEFADAIVPATATFTFSASGIVPVTYEWDFDANGSIDAASTRTNQMTHTFREAGAFISKGYVIDQFGRRYEVETEPIFVLVGATPPAAGNFVVTNNALNLPEKATLSLTMPIGATVEWDVDGDGHFDRSTPVSTLHHQYQRVGSLIPRARVIGSGGLASELTSSVRIDGPAITGWIIDPQDSQSGVSITGSSITLTAEAVPRGISKVVQFQYRTDNPPGAWIDIGAPMDSTGTRFSTQWDVSGLNAGIVLDIRLTVNGVDPLDPTNTNLIVHDTITVNHLNPIISESGTTKEIELSGNKSVFTRNAEGVELRIPYGAATGTLRIEPGESKVQNGSTIGKKQVGSPTQIRFISGSGPFSKPGTLRMPIPPGSNETKLSIHRYDTQAKVWSRDYPSQIMHADGLVEVRFVDTGIFAVFEETALSGGGGGCFGAILSAENAGHYLLIILAALIAAFLAMRIWKWIFFRSAILTLEDTVIASGSVATLTAWVERDLGLFWDPDLPEIEVEFLSEEGVIGRSTTRKEGRASLEVSGLAPGVHRFRARIPEGARYHAPKAEAYVGVYATDAPILVTDIDMTLAKCSPFGFITKSNTSVPPLIDSPFSIQKLAEKFQIVY
ncbi:MAG: PKD domain-containing protein, partial [Planctomycetota bacterium]|nr:PKD domain-containing protein [Planctomycetota bacterium]